MAGKSFAEYGNESGSLNGEPVYDPIQVTTALSVVVGAWQVRFCITRQIIKLNTDTFYIRSLNRSTNNVIRVRYEVRLGEGYNFFVYFSSSRFFLV